jgi:hypothetical protein
MSFKLPKNLLENLKPNEPILEALKTTTIASKPDWTILTDSRILYFNEKHLGRYDMVVIPYTKLSYMKAERGVLPYGSITLTKEDGEEVSLNRVPKKQIEPFINELEEAINRIAIEPITIKRNKGLMGKMSWEFQKSTETLFRSQAPGYQHPPPPPPPSSQTPLEMLNMRYARGEISDEEYQRMKQALGL